MKKYIFRTSIEMEITEENFEYAKDLFFSQLGDYDEPVSQEVLDTLRKNLEILMCEDTSDKEELLRLL